MPLSKQTEVLITAGLVAGLVAVVVFAFIYAARTTRPRSEPGGTSGSSEGKQTGTGAPYYEDPLGDPAFMPRGFKAVHDIQTDTADLRPLRNVFLSYNVPPNFDTRIKFGREGIPNSSGVLGCISAALDEGTCGASWAFAVAGMVSDRLRIESSVPSAEGMVLKHDVLSPEYLMTRGNQCTLLRALLKGVPQGAQAFCDPQASCQAGANVLALQFLKESGGVARSQNAEANNLNTDVYKIREVYNTAIDTAGQDNYYFFPGQRPIRAETQWAYAESNRSAMKELMTRGPVLTCMAIFSDIGNYPYGRKNDDVYWPAEGVKPRPGFVTPAGVRFLGNQCCAIIGWGSKTYYSETIPYWIVRMTWGEHWNGDGTFKVIRGQNAFNIELSMLGCWGYDIISPAARAARLAEPPIDPNDAGRQPKLTALPRAMF